MECSHQFFWLSKQADFSECAFQFSSKTFLWQKKSKRGKNKVQNSQKTTGECFTTKLKSTCKNWRKKFHSKKSLMLVLHQAIQLIKNLINHYTTTSMWMLVKASFFAVDDRSFIAILWIACKQAPSEGGKKNLAIEGIIP